MATIATKRNYEEESKLKETLSNLLANDTDEAELTQFIQEHESMQQMISEVLKGKQILSSLPADNKVSKNLKDILKNLELTRRNMSQMTEDKKGKQGDSDDSYEEPEFDEMGIKIKKAFNLAKLKAAQNIEELLRLKNAQRAQPQTMKKKGKGDKGKQLKSESPAILTKDVGTMVR